MPAFVSIEPANFCQLHCPECPVGRGSKDREHVLLSMSLFSKILDETKSFVHTMQFYFQGEPLLNPDLPRMIAMARKEGIYTIVSTNAQMLTPQLARQLVEAGLHRIIVSIDGMSEESYSAYRQGGSLHRALAGLGYLRDAKMQTGRHIHIELQCLRLKSNEHEWALLERSYRRMGADSVHLKTAQFYDYEEGHPLMPSDEKYNRYTLCKDGRYHPKNRLGEKRHHCRRIYTGCVIDSRGNVLPCCFDKSGQYVFGNLSHQSLRECWNSPAAQTFRKKVLARVNTIDICQNCTE